MSSNQDVAELQQGRLRWLKNNQRLVWDNHTCMPLRCDDPRFLPELERVRDAGIHAITLNVAFGNQSCLSALEMLRFFREWLEARPERFRLIRGAADVPEAAATGQLGVCFDIEGMDALEGEIANVEKFYNLGVRWMLAAYNRANAAGGGCLAIDTGLTTYGRAVISEMNRVGMVVCGSHCGYRTAREMIDFSAEPVIFSHSNPKSMYDHPRNIPDDLMKACASRGGVIGINGFGPFLGRNDASIGRFVDHIAYALDLVGEDSVGLGLDYVFDGDELDALIATDPNTFPPEFYSRGANMIEPWRLPEIIQLLEGRGYSGGAIRKVLGENHLRIAQQVWR